VRALASGIGSSTILSTLGTARLVPVIVVLDEFEPLARREARHFPGPVPEAALANGAQAACDFAWHRRLQPPQTVSATPPGSP